MPRPLTARQAAVLAAVERIGRPIMFDLAEAFPDLAPSAIGSVLDALERRGLVAHAGPLGERYLGGVTWWSTRESHEAAASPWTAAVLAALERHDVAAFRLPGRDVVRAQLPRVELEAFLVGQPSGPVDDLRDALGSLTRARTGVRAAVSVGIGDGPEAQLDVTLTPGF